MTKDKLIVGLPAGSLADPNRGGNLIQLLRNAGFPTRGYDQGGPSTFPLTPFLVGWDGRPQEFGSQLALNEVDVAIGGDDWVRERLLELRYEYKQDVQLQKILSLKRGGVRIVIVARKEAEGRDCDDYLRELLEANGRVKMVSEMPYLALEWFKAKADALGFGESHGEFAVQKFLTPPQVERGIVVYEAWGKTEAKIVNGSVDFGLEITQTGSAIRNYGLTILDDIMVSETGVWASPKLKDNPAKYDLARMFILNIYGSIFAEDKVLLFFNCKREDTGKLQGYLRSNALFGDEPTMNEGINFIEFSVQLEVGNPKLPLAQVRYELAKLGATAIETIPLESSIPGLHVLDF